MHTTRTVKKSLVCLILLASSLESVHASAAANNRNPASIAYVDTAIGAAIQTTTYQAGYGIRIDQPGNYIVATGATQSYVGVGAINITDANISARFSGTNGIYVPVSSSNNTGLIQGPTGGTGITITESSSGPGTINLDTTYTNGAGIAFTENSGTTTISTTPQVAVGDLYQGGVVFYVDDTGQHGLSVAIRDDGLTDPYFYDAVTASQKTYGSGIGAGAINTSILLARTSTSFRIAAETAFIWSALESGQQCLGLVDTSPCYGAFYLGATGEWKQLLNQLTTVNSVLQGLTQGVELSGVFWTSTEVGTTTAYTIEATAGASFLPEDKTLERKVRPFRQF